MKKLTAVEWFYETIINNSLSDWEYYFKQAKELEKDQIVDAFDKGNPAGFVNKDGEQYYSETFNQK